MLKQSLSGDRGFAVCMLNEDEVNSELKKIPAIATQCEVVNFDALEGGLLSIKVKGRQKVRLLSVSVEHDDLLCAQFTPYTNWSPCPLKANDKELADKLVLYFQSMPEIGALYTHHELDDLTWVCQRWIEVLPLEVHYKQLLITQTGPKLTARFLHKLFLAD
ncbi:Lon protease [Photobacterium japonica]